LFELVVCGRAILKMVCELHILCDGFSRIAEDCTSMFANCTCTLIKAERVNVIIDSMTPWDSDVILKGLSSKGLTPSKITHVVSSHCHPDHVGNNHLFLNAIHIVGFSVFQRDRFQFHPFETGEPYTINETIKIIPTPGHTSSDISVVVNSSNLGKVVVAGDIFEKEEDLFNPKIWRFDAGSECPEKQHHSRETIFDLKPNYIVPGHGPMFELTNAKVAAARKAILNLAWFSKAG